MMSGFSVQRYSEKKQKTISCLVSDTSYHKRCTQISGRNFNLVSRNIVNCYCQFCFVRNVPPSEVNESPTNDQNQSGNSLTNILTNPNSNNNYIEVSFDYNNHYVLINSKYFRINEVNALKTKENYFGIPHLIIVSLNKLIDGLFNLLSLVKLNYPIICSSEHKI